MLVNTGIFNKSQTKLYQETYYIAWFGFCWRFQYWQAFTTFITIVGKLQNYTQIFQSPNREKWGKIIAIEYSNFEHAGIFTWIEELLDSKAMDNCIICKKKLNKIVKLAKYKIQVIF